MNFQQDVLERSMTVPVVVDFWAPWCGPCRSLGPVIEQLAAEAGGRWDLVKINTDEHPEISARYNIMSIPAVKLFAAGAVAGEFVGALPRHQIQKWLDQYLPDPLRDQLNAIRSGLYGPAHEANVLQLQNFLQNNPAHHEASMLLAQALVTAQPAEALDLLGSLSLHAADLDIADDIRALAAFMELKPEGSVAELVQEAQAALATDDEEKAIRLITEAVMRDKRCCEELPRKAGVALFRRWGTQHPLTRQYRRMFDMALY